MGGDKAEGGGERNEEEWCSEGAEQEAVAGDMVREELAAAVEAGRCGEGGV